MIDLANFTNFERTEAELEELLIFSIAVAGKRSDKTLESLNLFMNSIRLPSRPGGGTWFERLNCYESEYYLLNTICMHNVLRPGYGIGQQNRMSKAWLAAARSPFDLRVCEVEDLMTIHGVGPKTARMFVLHSRPNQQYAVLDTHILKALRQHGFANAPKATPTNPRLYRAWELRVLQMAELAGMSPAEFDSDRWKFYAMKESTNESVRA